MVKLLSSLAPRRTTRLAYTVFASRESQLNHAGTSAMLTCISGLSVTIHIDAGLYRASETGRFLQPGGCVSAAALGKTAPQFHVVSGDNRSRFLPLIQWASTAAFSKAAAGKLASRGQSPSQQRT